MWTLFQEMDSIYEPYSKKWSPIVDPIPRNGVQLWTLFQEMESVLDPPPVNRRPFQIYSG